MHCGNITFIFHNKFSKYMKVERAMSEVVFNFLFNVGSEKLLSEKEKKISTWFSWKMGSKASRTRWGFWWYLDIDGLETLFNMHD